MSRIEINQRIKVYEREGEEVETSTDLGTIEINSHWCDDKLVVLAIGNETYAVLGADILIAVANAMNSGD